MTWIKFCGCTSYDDVREAAAAGADAVGFIVAPSPRQIALDEARRIVERIHADALSIDTVAVLVDPDDATVAAVRQALPQTRLQFSGDESPELVAREGALAIKAIHVAPDDDGVALERRCRAFASAAVLFDTKGAGVAGGTGTTFDWTRVRAVARRRPVIVAGGLVAENVGACVREVRPFGVDVRSGVESSGRKDRHKMRRFVAAVREADREA